MDPDERLDLAKQSSPRSVDLARWLSLASRVPAAMIRRARLAYAPGSGPDVEAELWFGLLVESRQPGSIVLIPDIAQRLRRELAARGNDLFLARQLVTEIPVNTRAPLVQIEDEMIWGCMDIAARPLAMNRLHEVFKAIVEQNRAGLYRWALGLRRRIPEIAGWKETDLVFAAAYVQLFGVEPPSTQLEGPLSANERILLRREYRPVAIGLHVANGLLRGREPPRNGDIAIQIPASQPRVLDRDGGAGGGQSRLEWRSDGTSNALPVKLPATFNAQDGTQITLTRRDKDTDALIEKVKSFFVTILSADGQEIGVGWLAKDDLVVTANNRSLRALQRNGRVRVRFPYLRGRSSLEGRLLNQAVIDDAQADAGNGVAVIQIPRGPAGSKRANLEEFERGAIPAIAACNSGGDRAHIRWHRFTAQGGELARPAMTCLSQLPGGALAQFAGAPVVDPKTGSVLGMCLLERGHAHCLSWAELVRLLPELRDRTSQKPVIFISYSHRDEPDHPRDGEVAWLSFVRTYLQPAVKHGVFDIFVDDHLPGGSNLSPMIESKLRSCDIFVLLVSVNSTASNDIIDTQIAIARERQASGEDVAVYPILLTPTPKIALEKLRDTLMRPDRPLSSLPYDERARAMSDIANEIADMAASMMSRRPLPPPRSLPPSIFVHITHLPETAYEYLVGRDADLQRLDDAWEDDRTNIVSLIAEGGAGKSALVNEWLKRMQADNYRGAETVLGWSFYSQGTKERATSAESFLNWAMEKLDIVLNTTSATAKGDAIAEALAQRRVLLVLDGVEPLQHGPDGQMGQLKDQGLRALLRRFAATPPTEAHSLIVLTSRLAVSDIAIRKDGTAPVVDVEKLSDEAGAALLRDNGVWGTDKELKQAAHDFGGHPLALGLLASLLKETQTGDIRRRDHVAGLVRDEDNPRHGHATRVMASYEKEWLAGQPVLLAIMKLVGLFDRPASADSLRSLRKRPIIKGLTDPIVKLSDDDWQRAVARLRGVRLIAQLDPSAPGALDAHPLVREWFGTRLKETNEAAWNTAHGRLYEHLRDTTKEGDRPSLEQLTPLYQAIAHGCRAGRHQDALRQIYIDRICRRSADGSIEYYADFQLGATASSLAAISWFFERPFEVPVDTLRTGDRDWVLSQAAFSLRALGRLTEAVPPLRMLLRTEESRLNWGEAWINAKNLCELQLLLGDVVGALASAEQAVMFADRTGDPFARQASRASLGEALLAAGRHAEADSQLGGNEAQSRALTEQYLQSTTVPYFRGDLLLEAGDWGGTRDLATANLTLSRRQHWLLPMALATLLSGRAHLGAALKLAADRKPFHPSDYRDIEQAERYLDDAVDGLRASGQLDHVPPGLRARAVFRRSAGHWGGAERDLDEAEEIAGPGPMRLYLCDLALDRARLAFARREAFAPLHGLAVRADPPAPKPPPADEAAALRDHAARQLTAAANQIEACGYHRRDAELSELQSVLNGARKFAELPQIRV